MYNGWKNKQTWNVALWLNNDEGLNAAARGWAEQDRGYLEFALYLKEECGVHQTPDGVSYLDTRLNMVALDKLMVGLVVESKVLDYLDSWIIPPKA